MDTSFDGDGIASRQFPTSVSEAIAVAIQSDDKIAAAGAASVGDFSLTSFGPAHYNPNGSLDRTFRNGGTVFADVRTGPAQQNAAQALLIQPDNKIDGVGYTNSALSTSFDFAALRLNPNDSVASIRWSNKCFGLLTI